ncbi:hypothetical protein Pmani_011281 [Petrolisthes manimaculis]|uniref:Uncharacterized protein n=1 Tax=Petrolisthes manimaculis TaxID=1843537 RepID=A0AAE1UGC8_9EUCA|nr:hypothetical protein Pmani_011281 [Petrolisthes manimaculis]
MVKEELAQIKSGIQAEFTTKLGPEHNKTDNGRTRDDNVVQLRQNLMELKAIEEKKLNLVMFNVPEGDTEEPDKDAIKNMIREEFKVIVNITEIVRLGNNTNTLNRKPRPTLVKFDSLAEKKQVLAMATKLRHSSNDIYNQQVYSWTQEFEV